VAASVGSSGARRAVTVAAALAALAFLIIMALSGRMRESPQYVKFEPAGLMRQTPEEIDRVELVGASGRLAFRRAGGYWTVPSPEENREQSPARVSSELVAHLEMSLRFMHATAPVRIMTPADYAGQRLSEFGLDPPRYAVSLHRGTDVVLRARFGAPNPQMVLQYVQVEGRNELYLLPVFVGREWELVAQGAPR
jgi:hypothetical protein